VKVIGSGDEFENFPQINIDAGSQGGGSGDTLDFSKYHGADDRGIHLESNTIAGTSIEFHNFEILKTTALADLIENPSGFTQIDLGAGNDTFRGSAGAESVIGGAGHDVLSGGVGDDSLIGSDDGSQVDLLIDGEGSDKIQLGARDITVAYDEGDSLYYGDLLLDGGKAAIHHDADGVPSIAYYLGSEGEIYISGGTALYVVLPNSEGMVAVLGGGGLQFGDETANTVEAQYTVDPYKVTALDTALSNLLTDWGWDSETGDLGPTPPAAAPDTSAWDTATAASNIPLDPV